MDAIKSVINKYQVQDKAKYISREFQDYGYRLACEMGEESRKSLYIKLAKSTPRALLERARSYVLDAPNVNSKGRLFMWVLKKLKNNEPI